MRVQAVSDMHITLSLWSLFNLLRDSSEMSLNPGRDNESDFETHLNTVWKADAPSELTEMLCRSWVKVGLK